MMGILHTVWCKCKNPSRAEEMVDPSVPMRRIGLLPNLSDILPQKKLQHEQYRDRFAIEEQSRRKETGGKQKEVLPAEELCQEEARVNGSGIVPAAKKKKCEKEIGA